jgi:hypothetical protein
MKVTRLGLSTALLVASAVSVQTGSAQASAGDIDSKGRIMTKVVVTMTEPGAFGRPVAGLTFLVVTESGDRVSIVTDDAGVAATWLAPASYRFVTPDPVEWQGKAYTWDLIMPVKAGSAVLKLSQENATKVVATSSQVMPLTSVANAVQPVRQTEQSVRLPQSQIPFQYKDGTTATVISLLITGGGQMYAGETSKGVAMLLTSIAAVGAGYAASGCDSYGCDDTGPLLVGYSVAVGVWVVSLVDAHNAAARHNAKAPRTATLQHLAPVIANGAEGTTKLGLSFRY